MSDTPPLGGHAPPLRCSRLLRWPDEASQCPHDATTHVIWTAEADNGLCCTQHEREAKDQLAYVAMHPYDMACSMPGAVFLADANVCVIDEGLLELSDSNAASGVSS